MAELSPYIDIMKEGLQKKSALLDSIIDSNERLEPVIQEAEMNMEQFRQLLDEKEEYVRQIVQLDEGFQTLFDKVRDEIQENKSLYRQQIQDMQQLIREITDKAVQIQETENRHRLVVDGQFARKRKNLKAVRQGVNVAQNYYKNMSGLNVVESQFLDRKN